MLIVFDLDDTLIRYGKHITVPRQTFHCLRDLKARGFIIACATYNVYGVLIAHECGLFKYIDFLQWDANTGDRSIIITKILLQYPGEKNFIYFDDRMDNLNQVKCKFPEASYAHVYNPLYLHILIKENCFGKKQIVKKIIEFSLYELQNIHYWISILIFKSYSYFDT